MNQIAPASEYRASSDVWVITSYYNPHGYRTRVDNFSRFADRMNRGKVAWLVLETAFDDEPFTLPPAQHVVHVRARHVMWQKERLLNLALERLPASCTKIAWLDCDILFDRADWLEATSDALDRHAVVQPFERVIRLPRGAISYEGTGEVHDSFG